MKVGDLVKKIDNIGRLGLDLGLVTSRDSYEGNTLEITWSNGEAFWYLPTQLKVVQESQEVVAVLT